MKRALPPIPAERTAEVDDSPVVPGLRFRTFRGAEDFDLMSRIEEESLKADGVEWITTADEIKEQFSDSDRQDPYSDVLFVDVFGDTVGYSRISHNNDREDVKAYRHYVYLLKPWRGKGIEDALFRRNEKLLEHISSAHEGPREKYLQVWAFDPPNDWRRLVEANGYTPVWHLLEMRHTRLDDVTVSDMPSGLAIRHPRADELRKLWDLFVRCFEGEPWFSADMWSDEGFDSWLKSNTLDLELIHVAWEGPEPVGVVEMRMDDEVIERIGRKVAQAWLVCVDERWRRKGVGSALLSMGLIAVRRRGATEVMLDTEAENKHKAMKLYESVGFQVQRAFTFYRKPLPVP
ncbi:MAG: GNAT family N-acetyltransferase [Methanobacteriota archaeon]|nr:MAG: GNAT family N-acetyltransferase [Euryarchaeota archaeon]